MHSKMRKTRGLAAGLLLFLALAGLIQAAGATVTIAAPTTIPVGQTVAVPVTIADVSGLYGFEMALQFDPTVVRVVDVDPAKAGVQLQAGDFLALDFLVRNTADNAAGTLEFVLAQLNPSEAQSGSGTLFTVYFEGLAAGKTSPLSVDRLTLSSRDGIAIPVTVADVELKVAAASSAAVQATPSPMPTAARPVLDMDVLTATPQPTAAAAATSAGAVTAAPTTAPPTPALAPTSTAPAAVTPAASVAPVGVTSVATQASPLPAATTPVTQPAAAATETVVVAAPAKATSALVAAKANPAPVVAPPDRLEQSTQASVLPARNGLLVGGGALLILASVALAGWAVLRGRRR